MLIKQPVISPGQMKYIMLTLNEKEITPLSVDSLSCPYINSDDWIKSEMGEPQIPLSPILNQSLNESLKQSSSIEKKNFSDDNDMDGYEEFDNLSASGNQPNGNIFLVCSRIE